MGYWALYEKLLGGRNDNGDITSARDKAITDSIESFLAGMMDDPAYQEDATVNGETTPIIAARKSSLSCDIKAAPGTDIHIGDMIECFDEQWIVVELYADQLGIISGEMWLCNNIIRFQNRSVAVITRHCVVDDGSYPKRGSDPDAFVMTNTYKIYITIDNATEKLFVDKRLAFGQIYSSLGEKILEVYKIVGMDIKSKNYGAGSHLMVLTVQRDVYNENVDSLSENLCDIFLGNGDTVEPEVTGSCVVVGGDIIRLGTTRKYSATFTDENGEIVSDVIPIWTVNAPDAVTYNTLDKECSISIPLDEKYVGETILITVSDENNIFGNYEKKVQVVTVG